MRYLIAAIVCLLEVSCLQAQDVERATGCKNLKFGSDTHKHVLLSLPLLMETGGAQVVRMPDGSLWLVGVGYTDRRTGGAIESMRQLRVTRVKAQAAIVEYLNSKISTVTVAKSSSSSQIANGKERAQSSESLDQNTVTRAKGIVSQLDVLGTWTDQDETIFFQALGKKLN